MLDFPASPSVSQIYTSGSSSWQFDGTKWLPYTAGSPYLLLTGGTLTGNLTIAPPTNSQLTLTKAASGGYAGIAGTTGANARWLLQLGDTVAESAGAGSNFSVSRYNDAGTFIDTPLTITRSSGAILLSTGLTTTASGGITIAPTSTSSQLFLRKSASGQNNLIYGQTGANSRWAIQLGDTTAESANTGSNFIISRYNDAGAWVGDPLSINRSSGLVSIANTLNIVGGTLQLANLNALQYGTNYISLLATGGGAAIIIGNAADAAIYYRNTAHHFQNIAGNAYVNIYANVLRGGAASSGQLGLWNDATNYINFHWITGTGQRLQYRVSETYEYAVITSSTIAAGQLAGPGWGGPTGWVTLDYDNVGGWYSTYCDGSSSDERIKENIRPTRIDALAALTAFQVSEFDYKAEVAPYLTKRATKEPVHIPIGFVAQHVAPHVPEAAFVPPIPYPDDSPLPSDAMMVFQHNFIPYLVRAIQQLSEQNAAMAKRLAALEA